MMEVLRGKSTENDGCRPQRCQLSASSASPSRSATSWPRGGSMDLGEKSRFNHEKLSISPGFKGKMLVEPATIEALNHHGWI